MAPVREEPEQLVIEAEVEAALPRVTLAARTAPELVVDPPALVALAAEHVEPAELAHLFAFGPAARLHGGLAALQLRHSLVAVDVDTLGRQLVLGQQLGIAPEDDVDAAAGHVGGHRDRTAPPRLGHDLGLTEVLLGVQHVVRHPSLLEQARQQLGLGHRGGADQHGLAELVALDDVVDHRVELGLLGLEHEIGLVEADHLLVGRDRHHGQAVGAGELAGLGLGGTRHAGQLVVQAEVVLQGHRGPGVVLLLDGHALLGLDRLVETVGPPPPFERAAGELVDDLHLAVLHEVVLVPLVEVLGREGLGELVDVVDRHGVVDVLDPDGLLHLLDPGLQRDDRLLLLIHFVVDVTGQAPGDGGELVVELRRLVGRPRDDERRARLVNEDGVDLVDDGEGMLALRHEIPAPRHVVAQVVEPELAVRPVGDVRRVGGSLDGGVVDVGTDPPHRQAEPAVDPPHPFGVTGGQVLVDRHHVHAALVEGVEVGRKRRDERLALSRLHFCDPPEVQGHATHELHVEVALAEHPPGRLAHDGVGLDEQVVQGLTLVEALPELHRLVGEGVVAQALHFGLEGTDERDELGQPPDLLAFAGAQDLREHAHEGNDPTGRDGPGAAAGPSE